jgi:hypothetical protein
MDMEEVFFMVEESSKGGFIAKGLYLFLLRLKPWRN